LTLYSLKSSFIGSLFCVLFLGEIYKKNYEFDKVHFRNLICYNLAE
jgi:hypothetical protein